LLNIDTVCADARQLNVAVSDVGDLYGIASSYPGTGDVVEELGK
jgi:hypothetical protein